MFYHIVCAVVCIVAVVGCNDDAARISVAAVVREVVDQVIVREDVDHDATSGKNKKHKHPSDDDGDNANKVLKTPDNTRSMTTNVTSSSSSELVVFQQKKKKIPINSNVVSLRTFCPIGLIPPLGQSPHPVGAQP